MKYKQRNPIKISATLGAVLLSSALLGSCGGGTSAVLNAGIGGTGIVFGTITGFGSVWVNGRRFEIDESEIIIDGKDFTGNSMPPLAVGMVVRIDVDTDANGKFAGAATKVEFDDAIEGPVDNLPVETKIGVKQIDILGQTIMVDAARTFFVGTTYNTVTANDILEVSGFRVDDDPSVATDDKIIATYVKKVGVLGPSNPNPPVELRGKVSDLVQGFSFKIYDVQINYAGVIPDVDGGQLAEGMFVEVEGDFVAPEVDAVKIEQEDEDFGADVDEIDLQGVVSQYDATPTPIGPGLKQIFFVNGQQVDASTAKLEPADLESLMQDGLEVEVEGEIIGGVLIADELELRADTELRSTVFSVNNGTGSFVVEFPVLVGNNKVTVNTSGQTLFEDDTGGVFDTLANLNLQVNDFVEVEGVEINGAAGVTVGALTVKRRDPNDTKLQGAVDSIDSVNFNIEILGITYPMDPAALYQEDPTKTADDFFAGLQPNDIVELEDYNEPADGDADEVELDD